MSHRHRALLRDSLRIAKNSAQLMANYAAGLRFEAAASTGMMELNSDRLWLQSTHWRRHGRWERVRIVKTPRGRGFRFPTVRVVPSGRCLWVPGMIAAIRARHMLAAFDQLKGDYRVGAAFRLCKTAADEFRAELVEVGIMQAMANEKPQR